MFTGRKYGVKQLKKRIFMTFMVALLFASAVPAYAATQGTPGPTSSGTVTINATITPEVSISNLNDITFDTTVLRTALNTGADVNQSDPLCVWSNNPDGSYFITATGDGAANAFTLNDGTRTLPYTVSFTEEVTRRVVSITSGTKSRQFVSNASAPVCVNDNALLIVTIPNAGIAAMEATTTYTGVLTLLVSPT
jgi:hypothetical protein